MAPSWFIPSPLTNLGFQAASWWALLEGRRLLEAGLADQGARSLQIRAWGICRRLTQQPLACSQHAFRGQGGARTPDWESGAFKKHVPIILGDWIELLTLITANCVPHTALRASYIQLHLSSQHPCEIEIMVNPNLQMRKSRHERFSSLPKVLKEVRSRAGI